MRMDFLPFPRGTTAKGDKDGNVIGSLLFFNGKGKPLLDALCNESERAQVLIGAAFIDNGLKRCLKAIFLASGLNHDERKELLATQRSLFGAFGAKIIACRAFGILEKGPSDAAEAIKNIRNAFAHEDFAISLADDNKKVSDGMVTLKAWLAEVEYNVYRDDGCGKRTPLWIEELSLAGELVNNQITERHVFLGAVIMLYLGLANIQWAIDPKTYDGAVVVATSPKSHNPEH